MLGRGMLPKVVEKSEIRYCNQPVVDLETIEDETVCFVVKIILCCLYF